MPQSLLEILKYFLIALLWLFFLRVTRAVWAEVKMTDTNVASVVPERSRSPKATFSAPTTTTYTSKPIKGMKLKILEPSSQKNQVFTLENETTIGRSMGCTIPLQNDTYVSHQHARIFQRDAKLWLEDTNSTNGTFLNGEKLSSPAIIKKGDRVKIGETLFEVIK